MGDRPWDRKGLRVDGSLDHHGPSGTETGSKPPNGTSTVIWAQVLLPRGSPGTPPCRADPPRGDLGRDRASIPSAAWHRTRTRRASSGKGFAPRRGGPSIPRSGFPKNPEVDVPSRSAQQRLLAGDPGSNGGRESGKREAQAGGSKPTHDTGDLAHHGVRWAESREEFQHDVGSLADCLAEQIPRKTGCRRFDLQHALATDRFRTAFGRIEGALAPIHNRYAARGVPEAGHADQITRFGTVSEKVPDLHERPRLVTCMRRHLT